MLTIWGAVPLIRLSRHMNIKTPAVIRILFFAIASFTGFQLKAQKVDSIYFHLYTDSLKKGTHNYINVDGKMSNGQWMPLTEKEIQFSASDYKFSGNELIVPANCTLDKVTVKAVLRSNPSVWIEKTIWVKKRPDPELPTKEEVMRDIKRSRRRG